MSGLTPEEIQIIQRVLDGESPSRDLNLRQVAELAGMSKQYDVFYRTIEFFCSPFDDSSVSAFAGQRPGLSDWSAVGAGWVGYPSHIDGGLLGLRAAGRLGKGYPQLSGTK